MLHSNTVLEYVVLISRSSIGAVEGVYDFEDSDICESLVESNIILNI